MYIEIYQYEGDRERERERDLYILYIYMFFLQVWRDLLGIQGVGYDWGIGFEFGVEKHIETPIVVHMFEVLYLGFEI